MVALQIKNLCKEYPEFKLDNVSFSVEEGRIAGFIGKNGAGKTTTIKSMLNIIHPSCGEITVFGKDIREQENEIKQQIGYSSGNINFYQKKKIKDITQVTKSFFDEWDDSAYKYYMDLFSLSENKSPSELSEGMKVKYNLALALSHNAKSLILDEPTSGLDPFSRDELLKIFIKLKERGVAILFSTHITSDLEKCADDIIYIRNGEIVCAEDKDTFIGKYSHDEETLEETILRLESEALSL